jgi:hypothetical protein
MDAKITGSHRRHHAPGWLLLLVFAAIAHQGSHVYFFNRFNPDKACQIVMAQSLLAGKGLSVPEINLQDFAKVDHPPVVAWPPGYSLLIASILPFTRDVWWSAVIVDLCATLLFFGSWFYVLEAMSAVITLEARALIWGFWALFFSPLEGLTSSDALGLALLSGSIAVTVRSIRHRSSGIWIPIAAGALAVASAAVKYMYWPLAAAVPAALLYLGFRDDSRLRRSGASVALLVAGGTLMVFAFQRLSTVGRPDIVLEPGHATLLAAYHGESDLGLHWRNLLRLAAFPAEALGVAGVWPHLGLRLKLPPLLSILVLPGLSIFVCVASLVALIGMRAPSRRHGDTDALVHKYLWTTVLLVSVLTLGMLSFLSLLTPLHTVEGHRDGYWTYVEELRHFAPVSLFMFFSIPCLVQNRKSLVRRVLATGGVLAMLFAASVAAREHIRNYSQRVPAFHLSEEAQFGADRATVMRVLRERSGTKPAVYLDSDEQLGLAAALVGSPFFFGDASQLAPVATETVTAIVGVPRTDVDGEQWQEFLSKSAATSVAETRSRRFYEFKVHAAQGGHLAP